MKTKKTKKNNSNKTKRVDLKNCPIGLKPFEKQFSTKLLKEDSIKKHVNRKRDVVKSVMKVFSAPNVKPKDDFYDYINYLWLKNTSVTKDQKYIVQIDDFRLIQDKVYKELNGIIVDYFKSNNNKLAKNLKNYYYSVIHMNPKTYTRKLAFDYEKTIESLMQEKTPWKLLAFINSDEMTAPYAPFVWSLNPDDKNVKLYRSFISPHQFSIVDLNVYYDDNTEVLYKKKYRDAYRNFSKDLFNTLLGKNNYNPYDTFEVEQQIFNALGCVDVTKNEESYNKVTKEEALEKYGFDWTEFSIALGFKKPPDFFITSSLNYLKCGSQLLLDNWNSPKWKTYWLWIILVKLARITKDWEKMNYHFFGNFERGQDEIIKTNEVSASLYMSVPFNTFLTNEYVKKYEDVQALKYVEILANDLKQVFKRILTNNQWLQKSTKKYALKKLEHFKFIYGKPEGLREDPDLNYGTLLYDNMKKVNDWRFKKFIELEGKEVIDIPMMDWTQYPVKMTGTQAYIVNASYTPAKNAIYINLGYIQKPFVDLDERSIEYNLAHVGFTLGHEMSHGFDDMGSKYGYDGNLNDWWTPEDKAKFKKIQEDVIKQYEDFAARDGIHFDASIGVGEDLADISGMAICNGYLRDYQEKNGDNIPVSKLSYELFFTIFAEQQKQKLISKKALAAQLKTNPHPLDKYRCNIPLSRANIFRAIYDVKKGDGMWWHNTNTVWAN